MIVEIAEEDYSDMYNINNVSNKSFLDTASPLYIGIREGQVTRMSEVIHQNKLFGKSIMWNELKSFANKDGSINVKKFSEFDSVYFAPPERVPEQAREFYIALIELVKSTLSS